MLQTKHDRRQAIALRMNSYHVGFLHTAKAVGFRLESHVNYPDLPRSDLPDR